MQLPHRRETLELPESKNVYSRHEYETLFAFRYQENPQQTLQIHQSQLKVQRRHLGGAQARIGQRLPFDA